MTISIQESKTMANPLLVAFEVIFIDWWMKPIFALMYSVTSVTMKLRFSNKINAALCAQGVNLSSDSQEFFEIRKYSILKDIEVQFATKSPLRFLSLGAALCVLGVNAPSIVSNYDFNWVLQLGFAIIATSVLAYFFGRWQMYKIMRNLI